MSFAHRFLVASNSEDHRIVCARTLLRKFPAAAVTECSLDGAKLLMHREPGLDAVVLEFDGSPACIALVASLRRQCAMRPIVAIATTDHAIDAIAAGVDRFVLRQNEDTLGVVMEELLTQRLDPAGRIAGWASGTAVTASA